jgi:RNA recognition motif-containing protein
MTSSDLEGLFAQHGTVQSVQVIMDRDTGRSKGFGFVEMATDQEARTAVEALSGQPISGRQLTINEARPRENHSTSRGGSMRRPSYSESRRY